MLVCGEHSATIRKTPTDARSMDMKKPPKEGGWKLKGGQRGSRTLDTRIFSPLLYQLSYLAVYVVLTCSSITISNLKRESNENLKKFGANASGDFGGQLPILTRPKKDYESKKEVKPRHKS